MKRVIPIAIFLLITTNTFSQDLIGWTKEYIKAKYLNFTNYGVTIKSNGDGGLVVDFSKSYFNSDKDNFTYYFDDKGECIKVINTRPYSEYQKSLRRLERYYVRITKTTWEARGYIEYTSQKVPITIIEIVEGKEFYKIIMIKKQ